MKQLLMLFVIVIIFFFVFIMSFKLKINNQQEKTSNISTFLVKVERSKL